MSKYKNRRIIANIYKDQMANINIDGYEKEAAIKKGVRLECSLSPLLFNLFMKNALQDINKKCVTGIKIQVEKIQMLRLADEIVLSADEKKELEEVFNCVELDII